MFALWLVRWLTPEAAACGAWAMKDLERGVSVTFYSSSIHERSGQGSALVMRLSDVLSPEAREWERDSNGAPVPPHLRWEWRVDVGDPLSMDGTLMLRDRQPVGEWLGTDTLQLGQDAYNFTLSPRDPATSPDVLGPWFTLVVSRDGERVLEGTATSLCLNPLALEDQQREIRTRAAYWLAQTRKPSTIVPIAARVEASPQLLAVPGRRAWVTATASTTLQSGGQAYGAPLLSDGDSSTAWCEGARDHGLGATLTLELAEPTDPVLTLVSGYGKDALRLIGNGQPRRVLATTDTGVVTEISFPYGRDPSAQEFAVALHAPGTTRIELELVEVWPGQRWTDTCISELGVVGAL